LLLLAFSLLFVCSISHFFSNVERSGLVSSAVRQRFGPIKNETKVENSLCPLIFLTDNSRDNNSHIHVDVAFSAAAVLEQTQLVGAASLFRDGSSKYYETKVKNSFVAIVQLVGAAFSEMGLEG
jgi:hypothetical protein